MVLAKFAYAPVIFSVVMAGAAALAAAAPPPPLPPGPGFDLINERCGFCHTTEQTFGIRKTPANWAVAVQSMIDRGAELTPEEQQIVVDYLAANRSLADEAPLPAAVGEGAASQSHER